MTILRGIKKTMLLSTCTAALTLSNVTGTMAETKKQSYDVGSFDIKLNNVSRQYTFKYESAPREVRKVSEAEGEYDLSNDEKISMICGDIISLSEFHSMSYAQLQSKLRTLESSRYTTISAKVWAWKNPGSSDMSKISKTISIGVTQAVAEPLRLALEEIYASDEKPVLEYSGGYNLRAKNNAGGSVTASIHAYGAAVDFNTSNADTYNSKGERLSNWNYGNRVHATTEAWNALPESQAKYNILYDDSVVVKVMKKYGFAWGGDWSDKYRDGMHFQWIDG